MLHYLVLHKITLKARILSETYGVDGALFLDEAKSIKIPDSHIEASLNNHIIIGH